MPLDKLLNEMVKVSRLHRIERRIDYAKPDERIKLYETAFRMIARFQNGTKDEVSQILETFGDSEEVDFGNEQSQGDIYTLLSSIKLKRAFGIKQDYESIRDKLTDEVELDINSRIISPGLEQSTRVLREYFADAFKFPEDASQRGKEDIELKLMDYLVEQDGKDGFVINRHMLDMLMSDPITGSVLYTKIVQRKKIQALLATGHASPDT